MQEYNKKPLVDILTNLTNRAVVKSKDQYVYLDTKKSVEVSFLEEGLKIENHNLYLDTKESKKNEILEKYNIESNKSVLYKDILYKGGDASASAIAGSVTLAENLGETNVKIIANNDSANEMSFNEALELSGLIAKVWRTAFFRYKELKLQVANATTVEELDLISWEEV